MNDAQDHSLSTNLPFHTLYIFGAGGFGREVAWLASQKWGEEINRVFIVDRPEYLKHEINGVSLQLLSETQRDEGSRFVVCLGDPRSQAAKGDGLRSHRPEACNASASQGRGIEME